MLTVPGSNSKNLNQSSTNMASEENKATTPYESLPSDQPSSSGAKRKRGRPRKYEHNVFPAARNAQPIQIVPPPHCTQDNRNAAHATYGANPANPSIQQDVVRTNQTSGGCLDPNMDVIQALPVQQTQGDSSNQSLDSDSLVKLSANQASSSSTAPLQGNTGRDGNLGKHFVGKVDEKRAGFYLISVNVGSNQVIRGWVQDPDKLLPVTPENDLVPELPMFPPSQIRKRESVTHRQAPAPIPVCTENVTVAKPLQMRRPVDKPVAKCTTRPTARPYHRPRVAAAVPVPTAPRKAESSATLPNEDTKTVNPQLPQSSGQIKQLVNPAAHGVQEPSGQVKKLNSALVDVVVKESPGQSQLLNVPVMDGIKESSGQIKHVNTTVMDGIEIPSDPREQPNVPSDEQQITKEPTGQSKEPTTKISEALTGVDGSKAGGVSDQLKEENNAKASVPAQTEAVSGTEKLAEASSAIDKPTDSVQFAHDDSQT